MYQLQDAPWVLGWGKSPPWGPGFGPPWFGRGLDRTVGNYKWLDVSDVLRKASYKAKAGRTLSSAFTVWLVAHIVTLSVGWLTQSVRHKFRGESFPGGWRFVRCRSRCRSSTSFALILLTLRHSLTDEKECFWLQIYSDILLGGWLARWPQA